MPSTQDERPVQALPPDGPHPALSEGVRPLGSERGEHDSGAVGGEHRVEAPGVLGVPISDQEPERPTLGEMKRQVPGLLGHPHRVRMSRRCGQVDMPRLQFDGEEHVQGAEPGRLDREEVGGEDPACLAAQELAPGRSSAARRRPNPVSTHKHPDRRRRDPDPELALLRCPEPGHGGALIAAWAQIAMTSSSNTTANRRFASFRSCFSSRSEGKFWRGRAGRRPLQNCAPEVTQGVKWPPKMSELPKVDGQTELGAGLAIGLPSARDWR